MIVQRVLDFIKTLEMADKQISSDLAVRQSLSERFSSKNSESPLSKQDVNFLLQCYETRWTEIADTKNDYTRTSSTLDHVNQKWIEFAKELEPLAGINHQRILIPFLSAQSILYFIKALEKEAKPLACDVNFRQSLFDRFSKKSAKDNLTSEDLQFLLACYKIRWEKIVDGENDYTRNHSNVNQHWINLAKKLEPLTKISYLKILIPSLTNEKDLNDFSQLTETVNLFNLYVGYGGTTLYRKWSLCEHLKAWGMQLSTYRSLTERKLKVVTVDELARLKECKQTKRQVFIGGEQFDNFWDLMRKKVFPRLRDQGHIKIGILPHLIELIEHYYSLKNAEKPDFSAFKNDVKSFFRRLYGYDLADVNHLYGQRIQYQEQEQYLLDIFIALQTANDFVLDYEMRLLSEWLFRFNPALKASCVELEPVYKDLARDIPEDELKVKNQSDAMAFCCGLIISIITTQFELVSVFTKSWFSFWDKTNAVFPEALAIHTILLPLIAANRPDGWETAYSEIIRDIIIPANNDSSWYTWITRYKSTDLWLKQVQNCQVPEFFEPELLFTALLHFDTNNTAVRSRIHEFLDNLIHTYAQEKNELVKQLRVNILFADFLKNLNVHHRNNLLMVIKLCNNETAQSKFLSNCTLHIHTHLSQLFGAQPEAGSSQFFPHSRKVDNSKLFNLPEKVKDVREIIASYKTQLSSLTLDKKTFEAMESYLRKISRRIGEIDAKKEDQPQSYLGAYN